MDWLLSIIITGISSFIATNLDDIIVLMVLFSHAKSRFKPQQVILGQYLGFTALILLSLPGLLGGLLIPRPWIGLLGLVPIVIGLNQFKDIVRDGETEETIVISNNPAAKPSFWANLLAPLLSLDIGRVAAITIANGGDNISIYVPLFASTTVLGFGIIIAIFYVMVGVWCLVAYWLTRHRAIAKILTRHGHRITPVILVGLGIFILLESKSYKLLFDW